jgi:demethylmenaquinone methyltransferase/2-methoxy-6-polyprenyl-1,4-benzoquinol methylase
VNNSVVLSKEETKISSMFSSIAKSYDLINDLMTFGLARRWRRQLVDWSDVSSTDAVLDCATGTGDLALVFAQRMNSKNLLNSKNKDNTAPITGIDFCKEMLELAPSKAKSRGYNINFVQGDVMNMPFKDKQFDVISIAYGLRNVSDPIIAIREMARVCKPGGRILILETGASEPTVNGFFIRLFFKYAVPFIGGIFSGNRSAYEYLHKSSSVFPARRKLVEQFQETELFSSIEYRSLLGGASYLYKLTI